MYYIFQLFPQVLLFDGEELRQFKEASAQKKPYNNNKVICRDMMMSWHGNAVSITGPLWGESTSHWWFPLTEGQYCRVPRFLNC